MRAAQPVLERAPLRIGVAEVAALGHVFGDLQRERVESGVLRQRPEPPPGARGVDVVKESTLLAFYTGRWMRPQISKVNAVLFRRGRDKWAYHDQSRDQYSDPVHPLIFGTAEGGL